MVPTVAWLAAGVVTTTALPAAAADLDVAPVATDDWTALGRCPMQQVWPLLVSGDVSVAAFRCPSDTGWTQRTSNFKYGWASKREFSYGVQWPFKAMGTMTNLATPYGKRRKDRLVLMADRNPGGAVTASRQHSNHPDKGLNGVDANGNLVQYETFADSKAGMTGDDIYVDRVSQLPAVSVPVTTPVRASDTVPDDVNDTVIVPLNSRP